MGKTKPKNFIVPGTVYPFDLHHINVPLLDRNFNLVFCDNVIDVFKDPETKDGWHDILHELAKQSYKGNLRKTELFLDQTTAMVLMLEQSNMLFLILPRGASPEIIAHEAFHLTLMICAYKGLTLTGSSEEVYAYTLGWIVKTVNKYKKKQKATNNK